MKPLYIGLFLIGFIYDFQVVLFFYFAQHRQLVSVFFLTFGFYAMYDIVWMKTLKGDYTPALAIVHALGYALGAAVALYMFPLN